MMRSFVCLVIVTICCSDVIAQKEDTLKKYIGQDFSFTTKKNALYLAMAVKSQDHWMLYGVYPDTTPLARIFYADKELTIKDGPYTLYHPKRKKAVDGFYAQNASKGVWRYYYPNGQLRDSGMLINNRLTGVWRTWTEDGKLSMEISYDSSALKQNIIGALQGNNSILPSSSTSAVSKYLSGESKFYYPNGQLKEIIIFDTDKKTGPYKKWYETGTQESIGFYSKDSMVGEWEFYRENGKLSSKESYKGNKVASMQCFDEEGKPTGSSCSILKPPVPQGKFLNFKEYLLDNIFWPKKLSRDVQGIVKVKFTVTKEGTVKDFIITSSPHELLSKEVERFFGTIPNWSPAVSHNRVIEYSMDYEVPFLRN